jgi:hypothetical protein
MSSDKATEPPHFERTTWESVRAGDIVRGVPGAGSRWLLVVLFDKLEARELAGGGVYRLLAHHPVDVLLSCKENVPTAREIWSSLYMATRKKREDAIAAVDAFERSHNELQSMSTRYLDGVDLIDNKLVPL